MVTTLLLPASQIDGALPHPKPHASELAKSDEETTAAESIEGNVEPIGAPAEVLKSKKRKSKNKRNEQHGASAGAKVFVGGLPQDIDARLLQEHFEAFGHTVVSVAILEDLNSNRSRGFGFVEFPPNFDHSIVWGNHLIGGKVCGVRSYEPKRKEKPSNESLSSELNSLGV
jgi:hypothetical protein